MHELDSEKDTGERNGFRNRNFDSAGLHFQVHLDRLQHWVDLVQAYLLSIPLSRQFMRPAACLARTSTRASSKLPEYTGSVPYHKGRAKSVLVAPRLHRFEPLLPSFLAISGSSVTGLRIVVCGSALVVPDEKSKLSWLSMYVYM
jgi:hypothetical protein